MSITPADYPDDDPLTQPLILVKHKFLGTSGTDTLVAAGGGATVLALQGIFVAVQCVANQAPAVATVTFVQGTVTVDLNVYAGVNMGQNQYIDMKGIRTDAGSSVGCDTNAATDGADFYAFYQVIVA